MRRLPLALLLLLPAAVLTARQTPPPAVQPLAFVPHLIDTGMKGGYQVVIQDLNRDRRPDVIALAIGLQELRWYENPGWEMHVIATNLPSMINVAAHDVDGDGMPELVLAHEFSTTHARSLGIVSLLTHAGDPEAPWTRREIDRAPTSHRLRFVDADGTGRKVLVNAPLAGPQAAPPDYRDRVPIFWYRPGEWRRLTITDAEEGVVHGIEPVSWTDSPREAFLSASFLGVHVHELDGGRWTRTQVTRGNPGAWPRGGTSDVALARFGRERVIATIEPWHGNEVVVYRERNGEWPRTVLDDSLEDAHTIVAADFDGDGRDEIVAGERRGRRSAYVYRADPSGDRWTRQVLDDDMAAAGCAAGDLNGDRRVDVVCIGTATANLKWYENAAAK